MKIGVIDYGMGNLFSVEQALKRLGCEVVVTSNETELDATDALLLPGVGAFPDAIKRLAETNLDRYLQKVKAENRPLLGICLGMQLLFEQSEEVTTTKGLGFFKGSIKRFSGENAGQKYRVPHMGWNELVVTERPLWLKSEGTAKHVYFVHSFYATDIDETELVAYADYRGIKVPGIVANGSITGMQFHPEKSGELGVCLLKQWLEGLASC
ncbi:imidazole glycerol phosphate synthase subunit HisH [Lysinibacillus sp. KCTC 33748]|uniref:imidazole glycerol phosphate synthase subunit HisH n=1 Tax=unclassified Lysinibacillus TaxID=2636778 RepID=UPI0009A6AA80|nr:MULTISPECIES: imidazole glycerol phosphate synthase subunit HisH [unclassified Lysinibacillus]OXS66905.1 imidazole glycerol phosphate synthase subunit HisH [Lysinibacillus sp. KCTC 33748]SKC16582.1 glutamine amidotransferase [Lysinibacillus sp. AC-3]